MCIFTPSKTKEIMTTTFTQNNATYTTTEIQVKGNKFAVTVVTGKYNYINIVKVTNNPGRTTGKDFISFDKAQEHYKCDVMKTELLKLELGL